MSQKNSNKYLFNQEVSCTYCKFSFTSRFTSSWTYDRLKMLKCKWFLNQNSSGQSDRTHRARKLTIPLKSHYRSLSVETARENEHLCGSSGKYYEPKSQ